MAITKELFGTLPNGQDITAYLIDNGNGVSARILNYGGIVRNLYVEDKNGVKTDVVLGRETMEDYLNNDGFLGALIGRHANRIAGGEFELNGTKYNVGLNEGNNSLHGGINGFDKKVWSAEEIDGEEPSLKLSIVSEDGEEGFPGTLKVTVTYTLTKGNALKINYSAVTDKDTVVNLTNHSYFNLNGEGSGTAMDQYLTIHAKYYTPVADSHSIPTGVYEEVAGTPMDFRTAKQIGQDIEAEFDQLKFTGGYDHNYVTDNYAKGNRRLIATAYSDKTGIAMDVTSDCPCVQFYAANFVENEYGKNGHTYNKRDAFCLETQVEPNAVNVEDFHSPILNAGEQYDSVTAYHFYIRK